MFTPCNRLGARYAANGYIDDSDGPLLFGLDIHRQDLLVDAERASVSRTASGVRIEAAPLGRLLVSRVVAGDDRARALTRIG